MDDVVRADFIGALERLCKRYGVALTVEQATRGRAVIIVHDEPDCYAPLGQACAIRFADKVNRTGSGTAII